MNGIHMMLTMMVALTKKEQLIDNAIDALTELKALGYDNERQWDRCAKECLMVFIKHTHGDKSMSQIMKDTEEKSKIADTAIEFNDMLKNLKKDS